MRIFIRLPEQGKKEDKEIDLNPDELIESMRKRIESKLGIQCHKLIMKGTSLKDDRTLRSYECVDGSVLLVQEQYYGQYLPMGVQPQMEKKRKAEEDDDVVEVQPEAKRQVVPVMEHSLTEANVDWIKMRAAAYGEKGMRRQMEDEHLICTSLRAMCPSLAEDRDFALFAIFDGHGGKQVAGFVKNNLPGELANAFAADEPKDAELTDKRVKKVIEATFHRLDSRIASELAGCYDGCTATAVLVNKEKVICINLGDSMTYLCRTSDEGEMQAIPLQKRQHKCWMMKEKERILRSGGAVENGRINGVLEVSRAFGDITLKKFGVLCTPEYMKFQIDLQKDQFVILACDGFWNAWTAGEALEYVQELWEAEQGRATREGEAPDVRSCCRDLVQHVIEEKKAQDNVSVVLLMFATDEN